MGKSRFSYSGLILELGAHLSGLALAFRDELFESQSIVFPQGKANIPQCEQHQLHILLCKTFDQQFQDVKNEERLDHLEVIQVADDGEQIIRLFALGLVLVHFIKPSHNGLEKSGPHLEKIRKVSNS